MGTGGTFVSGGAERLDRPCEELGGAEYRPLGQHGEQERAAARQDGGCQHQGEADERRDVSAGSGHLTPE